MKTAQYPYSRLSLRAVASSLNRQGAVPYTVATLAPRWAAGHVYARRLRKRTGCRPLNALPTTAWRSSATAFILGSGSSVNRYAAEQWAEIGEHDSIGFNWWLLHPFVPDIYVFEGPTERHRELFELRRDDYSDTPILLKQHLTNLSWERHRRRIESLRRCPEWLQRQMFLSWDFVLPGLRVESLRRSCAAVRTLGLLSTKRRFRSVAKRSGSLTFLVALALRAGYSHIVLCGVDLNNTDYFFQAEDAWAKKQGLPIPPLAEDGPRHSTDDPSKKGMPISSILTVMRDELLRPRGVELYVGASDSALHPTLPVYPWRAADHWTSDQGASEDGPPI